MCPPETREREEGELRREEGETGVLAVTLTVALAEEVEAASLCERAGDGAEDDAGHRRSNAFTNRGVRARACMWWTPSSRVRSRLRQDPCSIQPGGEGGGYARPASDGHEVGLATTFQNPILGGAGQIQSSGDAILAVGGLCQKWQ